MASSLIHHVRSFVREHDLVRSDTRVLAAVSGGSDSVALAHVLNELDRSGELRFAAIAHFNHRLRASADGDEAFVQALATRLGRAFVSDREDVAARAARDGQSLEHAGRAARHEFFERARVQVDADVVALGHTRNDQAETFLLRLLRGAGPRGLAAMHARNGAIVRPLLACRRDALRAWLQEIGAGYVHDETNDDLNIPRNRVRAELLPLLADRFNPSIVDTLADEAELLQEQWAWMSGEADAWMRRGFASREPALDIAELVRAPSALRRLIVWRVLTDASGGRQISFDHVAAVLRLTTADGIVDVPGLRVQRIGPRIVLKMGSEGSDANLFRVRLSIPGEVSIPQASCVVYAEDRQLAGLDAETRAAVSSGAAACVRRDLFRGSLVVRNRRPGDKFRPIGLQGSKKLQDLFVDRKVARDRRDAIPLVVDENDRIVWVAGFGIDEAFRVTDTAQAVLLLRLTLSKPEV